MIEPTPISPMVKEAQAKKVILKRLRKGFGKVRSVTLIEIAVKSLCVKADKLVVVAVGPADDKLVAALGLMLPSYINAADALASGTAQRTLVKKP